MEAPQLNGKSGTVAGNVDGATGPILPQCSDGQLFRISLQALGVKVAVGFRSCKRILQDYDRWACLLCTGLAVDVGVSLLIHQSSTISRPKEQLRGGLEPVNFKPTLLELAPLLGCRLQFFHFQELPDVRGGARHVGDSGFVEAAVVALRQQAAASSSKQQQA